MNSPAPSLIAIDGGQTAIKVFDGRSRSTFPALRTNTELMPQLADVVGRVTHHLPRTDTRTVAVGTTGLTGAESDPRILLDLCQEFGVNKVILAHDSITSFLGAVGLRRGVVVAAGTGVVTFGVGEREAARVDGWGNLMGDVGSGYWIGRAGLEAVMRAFDGRGPATRITDLATDSWPDLSQAYIDLQTDPGYVSRIASFASGIAALAETDDVAARICRDTGRELAVSAATALRRIGEDATTSPLICLMGGVFGSHHIKMACVDALREQWPRFEPFEPLGDGLAGAKALPSVAPESPLASMIAVAHQ